MNVLKKAIASLIVLSGIIFSTTLLADDLHSKYKGQENRIIKSLSEDDVIELKKGGGWGLAKAAELNGFPGPAHILEMEEEINLNSEQKLKIQKLFNKMNTEAVALGNSLISLETQLNEGFSKATIDQEELMKLVNEIAKVKAQLRFSHLSTHLETPKILTKHQVVMYNKLRGYGSTNPCENVPVGHNPDMWKKHNGCS